MTMARYQATIHEQGNGLADAGEYVSDGEGVYLVISTYGPIHTGSHPGAPNYIHAVVEDADWADVGEDEEPRCTVVVAQPDKED